VGQRATGGLGGPIAGDPRRGVVRDPAARQVNTGIRMLCLVATEIEAEETDRGPRSTRQEEEHVGRGRPFIGPQPQPGLDSRGRHVAGERHVDPLHIPHHAHRPGRLPANLRLVTVDDLIGRVCGCAGGYEDRHDRGDHPCQ